MIASANEVVELRERLDSAGKRLVFTNGCFDVLHAGHVRYLAGARALGDALVVALNSDESVRSLKGEGRPVNGAADRAEVLAALRSVDAVTVFEGDRATELIRALHPHVYAKGGDYTPDTLNPEERAALDEAGSKIEILPLVPGKSTSSTITAMREGGESQVFRIGVLGSGNGSNLEAIFRAIERGALEGVEIAVVIADVADCQILDRARQRGVPALFIDPGHPKRLELSAQKEIADRLAAAGVDLVVCAGFLRILKAPLLDAFAGRIINIHPSLLPKHRGLNAPAQALAAGDPFAGCTVHYVNAEIDAGEINAQEHVPLLEGDSSEALHARIQQAEHKLLPSVILDLANRDK